MHQQKPEERSEQGGVKFKAGMTLDEYLTKLHAQKANRPPSQDQSDSDIQAEALDHFQIRETDEDKEEESAEEHLDNRQGKEIHPAATHHPSEMLPYCFNLRLSQVQHQRPIHEPLRKNFRVTKRGLSQSPQKNINLIHHKGVDLFRSLYGHQFRETDAVKSHNMVNLHGTLYSKSIFPRIDERPGMSKAISLNKKHSKQEEPQFLLEEHLISTRQLLKLRGLPTEGPPPAGIQMRIEGVKDKYYERKSKSKSIKRY